MDSPRDRGDLREYLRRKATQPCVGDFPRNNNNYPCNHNNRVNNKKFRGQWKPNGRIAQQRRCVIPSVSAQLIDQDVDVDCKESLAVDSHTYSRQRGSYFKPQRRNQLPVQRRFPKQAYLDGKKLPPVTSSDIGTDETAIPPTQGGCYASPESQAIAFRFLEQYFTLYDGDDRQSLENAYHDSAILSLTCSYLPGQRADRFKLGAYRKDNRNLKRVESPAQRFNLVQKGKANIVSHLSKLPKTTHDPRSLTVDIPFASSSLIQISMNGIFKERSEPEQTIRFFQCVMLICPTASGICIVNEQLHITNATPKQAKQAFKDLPTASTPPAATESAVQPSVAEAAQDPSIEPLREQMVLSFAEQSGMNLEFSLRCLKDNDWDFNRAANVFCQLKAENKIPQEAFA